MGVIRRAPPPWAAPPSTRFSLAPDVGRPPTSTISMGSARAARSLVGSFAGASHLVAYAAKANSAGPILRTLFAEGCGADVVSGGELALVLEAGLPPDRVVFSGVAKRDDEIDRAILAGPAGICAIQAESIEELGRVAARARARRPQGQDLASRQPGRFGRHPRPRRHRARRRQVRHRARRPCRRLRGSRRAPRARARRVVESHRLDPDRRRTLPRRRPRPFRCDQGTRGFARPSRLRRRRRRIRHRLRRRLSGGSGRLRPRCFWLFRGTSGSGTCVWSSSRGDRWWGLSASSSPRSSRPRSSRSGGRGGS